jgi:hypothetical protein
MNTASRATTTRHLAAAALLMLGFGAAGVAQAQSTQVIINLPSIAILNYTPEVTVTIPAAAFGSLLDQGSDCAAMAGVGLECDEAATSGDATFASGGFSWNADTTMTVNDPTFVTSLAAVPLVLEDVWAIRGIWATTADVTAALVVGGETLAGPSGSAIEVNSAATVGGDNLAPPGFVAGNAEFGDVTLSLDLTGATHSGAHQHATLDTYTLSVAFD